MTDDRRRKSSSGLLALSGRRSLTDEKMYLSAKPSIGPFSMYDRRTSCRLQTARSLILSRRQAYNGTFGNKGPPA